MNIDIAGALNRAIQRHAVPGTGTASPSPALMTSDSPAARVTLSQEASSASDAARANASEMREIIGKLDFHHITPREMATLGSELFGRKELTDVETSAFIGIENSFATTQDPDKPLDVVAHFEKLLDDAHKYASEAGTDNGIRYRQSGLDALRNVLSFVSSDRIHIAA